MDNETLFDFLEDQYNATKVRCVFCDGELTPFQRMFIEQGIDLSLPICLVCEQGIDQAVEDVERKLGTNGEG